MKLLAGRCGPSTVLVPAHGRILFR